MCLSRHICGVELRKRRGDEPGEIPRSRARSDPGGARAGACAGAAQELSGQDRGQFQRSPFFVFFNVGDILSGTKVAVFMIRFFSNFCGGVFYV